MASFSRRIPAWHLDTTGCDRTLRILSTICVSWDMKFDTIDNWYVRKQCASAHWRHEEKNLHIWAPDLASYDYSRIAARAIAMGRSFRKGKLAQLRIVSSESLVKRAVEEYLQYKLQALENVSNSCTVDTRGAISGEDCIRRSQGNVRMGTWLSSFPTELHFLILST